MAFIIKFVKGVRNHWKKSTFAAGGIAYGIKYAIDRHETNKLMRIYCEKAVEYGKQPLPDNSLPRTVTVILNPNANKRKATRNFEKYCAPILNLAGICVDVIQTDSEGHAKTVMNDLAPTDAIVVAGGDGTLSEVVTGILRRTAENKNNISPIGILPLGKHNTVAKSLFPGGNYLEDIRSMADATLAIVEEMIKPVDVMRIELVDNVDKNESNKPVYAISSIEWGAYRDAQVKKDSYWYFGNLRKYATYIFNGYKDSLNWNCEALIKYSLPCDGCSNCHVNNPVENKRWYNRFISNKSNNPVSKRINTQCKEIHEQKILTSDFGLLTSNAIPNSLTNDSTPKLRLNIGPEQVDYLDFVKQGWRTEQGQGREITNSIEARQIEIHPSIVSDEQKELWFSIDKEDFEVKPVRVTLLPKFINMFCKKNDVLAG